MAAAFLCEVVLTAVFLIVIMGATHGKAPAGFAPLAIGLSLTLIHLISIPVTNTSVNPARSTAVAFFAGSGAVSQLWLFWVARCWAARSAASSTSGSATTAEAVRTIAADHRPQWLRLQLRFVRSLTFR